MILSLLRALFAKPSPVVASPIAQGTALHDPTLAAVLRAAGMVSYDRWARHLSEPCARFQILHGPRLAAFAATIAHESAGGVILSENLNYSVGGLQATWPTRFPASVAQKLGRAAGQVADQQGIAEIAYGGRMGNNQPGDGWKYRGRGLIQLTGRDAYRQAGDALGLDLEGNPDQAAQESHAALIAAWTWASWKGCNQKADAGDTKAWRRAINGGLNGLVDVERRYRAAMAV
jgi:putative chitinase